MQRTTQRWNRSLLVLALAIGMFTGGTIQAQGFQEFKKIFPLEGVPGYTAKEMVINCGGEYPNARATMWLRQANGKTSVVIGVRNAPPNAIFTIWLKLALPSPLTNAGVTALANTSKIDGLAAITPDSVLTDLAHDLGLEGDDGTGGESAANGFRTNAHGYGFFAAHLNFPIIKGAYPFQDFDPSLSPVAIDNAPFTLRLATHCTDEKAHGLVAGVHEMFFDWGF